MAKLTAFTSFLSLSCLEAHAPSFLKEAAERVPKDCPDGYLREDEIKRGPRGARISSQGNMTFRSCHESCNNQGTRCGSFYFDANGECDLYTSDRERIRGREDLAHINCFRMTATEKDQKAVLLNEGYEELNELRARRAQLEALSRQLDARLGANNPQGW